MRAAIFLSFILTASTYAKSNFSDAYVSQCLEEITAAGEELSERVLGICAEDAQVSVEALCARPAGPGPAIIATACQRFILGSDE